MSVGHIFWPPTVALLYFFYGKFLWQCLLSYSRYPYGIPTSWYIHIWLFLTTYLWRNVDLLFIGQLLFLYILWLSPSSWAVGHSMDFICITYFFITKNHSGYIAAMCLWHMDCLLMRGLWACGGAHNLSLLTESVYFSLIIFLLTLLSSQFCTFITLFSLHLLLFFIFIFIIIYSLPFMFYFGPHI